MLFFFRLVFGGFPTLRAMPQVSQHLAHTSLPLSMAAAYSRSGSLVPKVCCRQPDAGCFGEPVWNLFFEGLVIGNQQLNCEKCQQSTLFKGIWSVLYFSDIRTSTHIWAHKHTKTTCRYIKTQIDKNWRILTRLKNVIASVHEEPFGKSTPYLSWIELQNSRKMPSTGDIHLFFNKTSSGHVKPAWLSPWYIFLTFPPQKKEEIHHQVHKWREWGILYIPLIHLPDLLEKKNEIHHSQKISPHDGCWSFLLSFFPPNPFIYRGYRWLHQWQETLRCQTWQNLGGRLIDRPPFFSPKGWEVSFLFGKNRVCWWMIPKKYVGTKSQNEEMDVFFSCESNLVASEPQNCSPFKPKIIQQCCSCSRI